MPNICKICYVLLDALSVCKQACESLFGCIKNSPLVFLVTTAAVFAVLAALGLFNMALVYLLTLPGAIILNMCLLWCLLRLIVRALVFPGSIVFWKRNTEASYRVEIAKQFACHVKHLHDFLSLAIGLREHSTSANMNAGSVDSVMLGCMVIQGLAHNFRTQQSDKVRFTTEQDRIKVLVQDVEAWLKKAKVCEKRQRVEAEVGLLDWLQRISRSLVPVPLEMAISNAPLEACAKKEGSNCVTMLEELTTIFEELQRPKENCCSNSLRFLREPPIGSLHQLRAELKTRYSGAHHWIRVGGGRKIDAMLIQCRDVEGGAAVAGDAEDVPLTQEETPLKSFAAADDSASGPVIVWCNPNAAYYETMAYESRWLDFYLGQGCSILVFNYSGFGRSQGSPTPAALAADGGAVIDFLKRRGYRQIGVHGRSIGGIAACTIANQHPDVVKLLVADRTFSTLATVAKFTFGNWAVTGLSLSATWADNLANYVQARCYKVLICDPRDTTIPDLASLRTAVASNALGQVVLDDRLVIEDDKIVRLADAWHFLSVLVGICESDEFEGRQLVCPTAQTQQQQTETKRAGRHAVIIGKTGDDEDREDDTSRFVVPPKTALTAQWLEDNIATVRAVMAPYADGVRSAIDIIGANLNAGGMTLDEALGRGYDEPRAALRAFLANMQVWGSLGSVREPLSQISDRDVEALLHMGTEQRHPPEVSSRLARVLATLTPDWMSSYHRQLSRALVAQVHQSFKKQMVLVSRALETPSPTAGDSQALGKRPSLRAATLAHLREVEDFLARIYHFFKCVDTSVVAESPSGEAGAKSIPAAASEAAAFLAPTTMGRPQGGQEAAPPSPGNDSRPPQPAIDRAATGYMMCVECGHNGALSEGEMHHLSLHLRAASFGRQDGSFF